MVHVLPADLKRALTSDAKALETWRTLRLSRAMNGSAGSSWQKGWKQELAGSNGAVASLKDGKRSTLLLAWLSAS